MLAAASAVVGCGGAPREKAKSAPRERPATPPARPLLDQARALSVASAPFESEQHFGKRGRAVLHLRDVDRPPYASLEPLPDGAEIALVWTPLESTNTDPSVLFMKKTAAGFRYELERPGGSLGSPMELSQCARCHAEAPHDELFRVALLPAAE